MCQHQTLSGPEWEQNINLLSEQGEDEKKKPTTAFQEYKYTDKMGEQQREHLRTQFPFSSLLNQLFILEEFLSNYGMLSSNKFTSSLLETCTFLLSIKKIPIKSTLKIHL